MERQVLDVLSFRINCPTPYTFLRFFRHFNPMQPAASSLASYLIVSASNSLQVIKVTLNTFLKRVKPLQLC